MAKHDSIPDSLEAKLMVESRRTCNLCWDHKADHIHHIASRASGGDNSEDNLILLCSRCHSKVHTTRTMARNISAATLRLYKETWLDLVRRYPMVPNDIRQRDNDIETILGILKEADRQALYFPVNVQVGYQVFDSLNAFRIYIQSSGYRLLHNEVAKNHIRGIYKALVELELITPSNSEEADCLYGTLGRNGIEYLETRRRTLRYHVNELAKMIGQKDGLFTEDEFDEMRIDVPTPPDLDKARSCFRRYSAGNPQCRTCDYAVQCQEATRASGDADDLSEVGSKAPAWHPPREAGQVHSRRIQSVARWLRDLFS